MASTTPMHYLTPRFKDDDVIEAGIDEAGRGCFWGPIMAGALILPPESEWTDEFRNLAPSLRDSKKIACKKRERIAEDIKRLAVSWSVGSVDASEIDEKGITWANQEAFRRAIDGLNIAPRRIIIDGELPIPDWEKGGSGGAGEEGEGKGERREQHTVVEGDGTYLQVAGASILAKVTHDQWISRYCETNPQCQERYNLLSSHGYGTAKHREGLRTYGAHELHRRTFVRNWVPDNGDYIAPVQKPYKPKVRDTEKCLIRLTNEL